MYKYYKAYAEDETLSSVWRVDSETGGIQVRTEKSGWQKSGSVLSDHSEDEELIGDEVPSWAK